MQKSTKLTLRMHLTWNVVTPKTPSKHVIDGGALLFKVQWLRDSSHHDLVDHYVKHWKTKHKNSDIHVVFDGYNDPLPTKANVTDVTLVLHNEGHCVHYDQKHQQKEGTHGIFGEESPEQEAPYTRSVVCLCLDRLQHHLSNLKPRET